MKKHMEVLGWHLILTLTVLMLKLASVALPLQQDAHVRLPLSSLHVRWSDLILTRTQTELRNMRRMHCVSLILIQSNPLPGFKLMLMRRDCGWRRQNLGLRKNWRKSSVGWLHRCLVEFSISSGISQKRVLSATLDPRRLEALNLLQLVWPDCSCDSTRLATMMPPKTTVHYICIAPKQPPFACSFLLMVFLLESLTRRLSWVEDRAMATPTQRPR